MEPDRNTRRSRRAPRFGGWVAANLGWLPGIEPWAPSFVTLIALVGGDLPDHLHPGQSEPHDGDRRHRGAPGVATESKAVAEVTRPVAPEAVLDALESTARPRGKD